MINLVTILNNVLLRFSKPISPCSKILIVSEFQRCASTSSLFQSFNLIFKMHIIITMIRIPLLGRRRGGKLSLTPLLSPPFFLYFWTDGWSNIASPTTPSCLYIFHIVESTLKCTLSLGCRYFQLLGLKCADYHILM